MKQFDEEEKKCDGKVEVFAGSQRNFVEKLCD